MKTFTGGTYKVEFRSNWGRGVGYMHLSDGRAVGGDGRTRWLGVYLQNQETGITLLVWVVTVPAGVRCVFGKVANREWHFFAWTELQRERDSGSVAVQVSTGDCVQADYSLVRNSAGPAREVNKQRN